MRLLRSIIDIILGNKNKISKIKEKKKVKDLEKDSTKRGRHS